MQKQRLKTLPVLVGLLLMPSLTACVTDSAAPNSACLIFPAPSYSSKDTPETIAWFEDKATPGYAIKWQRLCGDR